MFQTPFKRINDPFFLIQNIHWDLWAPALSPVRWLDRCSKHPFSFFKEFSPAAWNASFYLHPLFTTCLLCLQANLWRKCPRTLKNVECRETHYFFYYYFCLSNHSTRTVPWTDAQPAVFGCIVLRDNPFSHVGNLLQRQWKWFSLLEAFVWVMPDYRLTTVAAPLEGF